MQGQGPTLEAVIGEAFRVGAQVVLSSRVYQAAKAPEQGASKRKSWFNLELDELESANSTLEPWRKDVGRPLVLEVFLQPWGTAAPQTAQPGLAQAPVVETVLEQWVFHYQPTIMPQGPGLSRSQLSRLNPTSIYKRLIILLRSLVCYVRVLPAYRMYRVAKRQRGANFTIGYRVSGTLPKRPAGAGSAAAAQAPAGSGPALSGGGGSKGSSRRPTLQQFEFAPVDTPYGQFRVSVCYQPASRVTILEQTTSPPPLPQIIADYVGGVRPPAAGQLGLRHAMSASLCSPSHLQQPQQQLAHGAGGAGLPASPTAAGAAGGMQRQASAFTPLPRHSWSSSAMRISPNRLGSTPLQYQLPPPGATPPSPFEGRAGPPVPYGSAPQLSPLQSPPLLRAVSMQARLGAGGTPPRCRPPLPPQRAAPPAVAEGGGSPALAAAGLGARPIPSGRQRAASLPARQQQVLEGAGGGEGEEGESEGEGSSATAGSARQSSAPMSIPGRSPGHAGGASTRRLRSSSDLWGMHQPTDVPKPLSAPAVSHLPLEEGAALGDTPDAGEVVGSHATDASLPPGPLPLIPGSSQLESESSGSAASSALFPTSCSPQLPFAFTPSAQSLAGYGSRGPGQEPVLERVSPRHRRLSSGAGASPLPPPQHLPGRAPSCPSLPPGAHAARGAGPAPAAARPSTGTQPPGSAAAAGGQSPSPPHVQFSEEVAVVTGREVSTSAALARRASWSGRSSALLRKSSVDTVGYSVSPMQDAALMESVLGGSTPRQYSFGMPPTPAYPGPALRMGGGAGVVLSRAGSSVSGGTPPPLLAYPPTPTERSRGGGGLEEPEADALPFALDGDANAGAPPSAPGAPPRGFGGPAVGVGAGGAQAPVPAPPAESPAPRAPEGTEGAGARDATSSDAAVGAFVRLLQEAPRLRSFGGDAAGAAEEGAAGAGAGAGAASGRPQRTLQAGLKQFELLRERLQSRGLAQGAVDA